MDYAHIGVYAEMSEIEVIDNMMRGHESMMAVLSSRHRSLQIINSLWHNKDMKVNNFINIKILFVIINLFFFLSLRRQSILQWQ